MTNKMPGL